MPAAVGRRVLEVAAAAQRGYERTKQNLGVLDFGDLLVRTRRLLADPAHAELVGRLSAQIELVLVDEFQDTDPLQVELVRALAGGGIAHEKLFFVGDYKQSIYRFRGADPDVFRSLRRETATRGRQSLTRNFRTQPAILEFINALFCHDLGDEYEALVAERPQTTSKPCVEFLWAVTPETAEPGREKKDAARRREADWIARRIRGLIDGGQRVVCESSPAGGKPVTRAAQPGDVAILLRALSDVAYYEDALRRRGIDYYLVGGHAFYAQQEIFDVVNLLRTLNSPGDLVSLVGVLRSGFFALTDETIFWLAQDRAGLAGGLFAERLPSEIGPEQARQVRFAGATIAELRGRKDRLRICELIDEALERTGYDAALLNEFLGERKLANLRKLVEQARGFQRGDYLGLGDFIAELSEFVAAQPDEPLAAMHSEDMNVVRLMTVHQSKGLEFPIVIVPDVERPTHFSSSGVHLDRELGPLVRLPSRRRESEDAPPAGYELWRMMERQHEAAELNRLLYVATTRAADYLILSSGASRVDKLGGPWGELLSRRFDLATGKLIGPLPEGYAMPEVRVTTEEPPADSRAQRPAPRVDVEALLDEAKADSAAALPALASVDAVAPDPARAATLFVLAVVGRVGAAARGI